MTPTRGGVEVAIFSREIYDVLKLAENSEDNDVDMISLRHLTFSIYDAFEILFQKYL